MSVALFSVSKQKYEEVNAPEKFANQELEYRTGLGNMVDIGRAYFSADRKAAVPDQLPFRTISATELLRIGKDDASLYRLGHSSVLIHLDGHFLLTDPVFSDRASPTQWMGPKRFHPVPLSVDSLPRIKAVIISHDHYDHLDKASIQALDSRVEYFLTPLRVGSHLRRWGIKSRKIIELGWWQEAEIDGLTLTATPAQHFSGRGLLDRDKTQWASWVIAGKQAKLFFSGDSGYFGGFKEIGERYGPFDLTMIETGAYNELWSQIHMLPEQSVQAHLDLKGKAMLPIHNGTFDLALHDWFDPFERSWNAAQKQNVKLLTPMMGEVVNILAPETSQTWWRQPQQQLAPQLAYE